MKTGWEREYRIHFDDVVSNYDSVRPEYPADLFNNLFDYCGKNAEKNALEIGAGTGKATDPVLSAGYNVTAVEIGSNMVDFLRKKYKDSKRFNVIIGAFEDVDLKENVYDLVYAASAFHWVDAQIGCPKVERLLKNGGVFALLRYNFNISSIDNEKIYNDIQEVYKKYYYSHYTMKSVPARITHDSLKTPERNICGFGFESMENYGFRDISMKLYDASKTLGADEYIIWLDTMSDHRALPESNRVDLYAGVKDVITKHGGFYKFNIIFQLYMGRKIC